ncbi:MAG: hypothetical protein AABW51_00380 [Nanoarchaeota archaeon]
MSDDCKNFSDRNYHLGHSRVYYIFNYATLFCTIINKNYEF